MHTPVYAAVLLCIIIIYAVDNRQGLLGSGTIVEIYKGLVVYPLFKNGKIPADPVDIVIHEVRIY